MSQTEILKALALPPHYLRAVQHLQRTEKMTMREILRNAISTEVLYDKYGVDGVVAKYREVPTCE
jgi:hypothetical protein